MKPEQLEIGRLNREVTKLKAERGIPKTARLLREGINVKFGFIAKRRGDLAGGLVVRGARCLARWLLYLADMLAVGRKKYRAGCTVLSD
jgi:hypothetical protein